jgi:hypothetical protein
MKTRPGIIDDAARARAVTPHSPAFTARDRNDRLTAAATDRRACPRAKAPGGR